MLSPEDITERLQGNMAVFKALLAAVPQNQAVWKPIPERWNLLDVVCHLYDEERDDFRKRVDYTLHQKGEWPAIDPVAWVAEHNYARQDFAERREAFLNERLKSVEFLKTLPGANWDNTYAHPKLGKVTAADMLRSWLAHDLLHIRQITRLNWDYLAQHAKRISMNYAGNW